MIRNAKPSSYATLPRAGAVLALCALLSACAVGPDYQRPALDVGAAYKEGQVEVPGWKQAQPRDDAARGPWCLFFVPSPLSFLFPPLFSSLLPLFYF